MCTIIVRAMIRCDDQHILWRQAGGHLLQPHVHALDLSAILGMVGTILVTGMITTSKVKEDQSVLPV